MRQEAHGPDGIGARARVAARAAVLVSAVSRRLHLGGGSVIGGKVALALDPRLVEELARSRIVALVSGTNGKTTTTRLLTVALGGSSRVATSAAGANLPSGVAAALAASPQGRSAVLEVDEGYLGAVSRAVSPAVVVLLNLSRDQLDRVSEVRMLASRWRSAFKGMDTTCFVANCDDPLVTWAARGARRVEWVAAGQLWRSDSVGCPACEGQVVFTGEDWSCTCGFARPAPDFWLEGDVLVTGDGRRLAIELSLPGRFNKANAAMAALAASALGIDLEVALSAMAGVGEVEGRFANLSFDGALVRLLLAKNPAGWTELLGLLADRSGPVVIGINAKLADGHDPSWLWDVPFEQLRGRTVVATAERCWDLAVRLRHADVDHVVIPSQLDALRSASGEVLDYVGNYTAFQQLRRAMPTAAPDPENVGGIREEGGRRPVTDARSGSPTGTGAGHAPRHRDGVSALRVVVVHPDLLGTYGDTGNGLVLVNRAVWRGIDAELYMGVSGSPLPSSADVYCLGGGEDGPQVRSAELLSDGTIARALDSGAAVLAVCAGYQIVGNSFADADGSARRGVGILDVQTVKGTGRRAVGEILCEVEAVLDGLADDARRLTGFENHSGVTRLGPGVRPLARLLVGVGNGAGDATEGAVDGRVIGTYLHGPVLARNPALADALLSMVSGSALEPLDDSEEEALRRERLAAIGGRRRRVSVHGAGPPLQGWLQVPRGRRYAGQRRVRG